MPWATTTAERAYNNAHFSRNVVVECNFEQGSCDANAVARFEPFHDALLISASLAAAR
jgi:hypothetical protein